MSPLPERRKTPEELAELRESLGISAEGPPPDAPGVRNEDEGPGSDEAEALKSAVFEEPAADSEDAAVPLLDEQADEEQADEVELVSPEVPETEGEPSVVSPHSLRKSASLVVDQPKPIRHRPDGSLPSRRHTDEELMRLRRMDAAPAVSPIEDLARRTVPLPAMILFYLLAAAAVALLIMESLWFSKAQPVDLPFEWLGRAVEADSYGSAIMGLIGGLSVLVLLVAGWISWRRPLSRHHAGFMTIIAVLVLVFGTLYFFPGLHGA